LVLLNHRFQQHYRDVIPAEKALKDIETAIQVPPQQTLTRTTITIATTGAQRTSPTIQRVLWWNHSRKNKKRFVKEKYRQFNKF